MNTGTKPSYPERPRFFAMKFLRLLAKTAAAQELGADACWLLTVIATLEDVNRYRRGVTFYNEQLMPLLGFTRWHRLDAVRKACIDAGWLHYEAPPSGVRGKPGVYWVTIPSHAHGLPDGVFDEGKPSTESVDTPNLLSTESVEARDYARVEARVDGCVELPYPIPIPIPFLSQGRDEPAGKPKKRTEYPAEFEAFWKAYPPRDGRRNGKEKSLALWKKIPADDRPLVQVAAEAFAKSRQAIDNKARDPERFLKENWWRDWLSPEQPAAAPSQYRELSPRSGRATA